MTKDTGILMLVGLVMLFMFSVALYFSAKDNHALLKCQETHSETVCFNTLHN